MSAIFGIWNINGEKVNQEYVVKMRDTLLQYGSMSQDVYINYIIALGCCLRRDNSISENEIPVVTCENKELTMVADAQIFNRSELIEKYQLTDDVKITNNNLLMAAYEKWGEECPNYINGSFSFVIWNKRMKNLTVFEDQLGIRPLYYFYNKEVFAFATDYRALLALPFVGKELYDQKMYGLLSGQYKIEPEATYFKQIKQLTQSSFLHIDTSILIKKKYWTPGLNKAYHFEDEEECVKMLYNLVEDAVKIRLEYAEGIVGTELSGGLDSSVIAVLAARELENKKNVLECYSWSPSFSLLEKLENDEREFIEEICQKENAKCTYFDENTPIATDKTTLNPPETASGDVVKREYDFFQKKGIHTILSGWGGDQGISHRAGLYELYMNGCKKQFFHEIFRLSKGSPIKYCKLLLGNTVLKLFGSFRRFQWRKTEAHKFLNKTFYKSMKKEFKKDILYFGMYPIKHVESGNIQSRTITTAWIGADYDMLYLFPFLDYRVMDFALSVPRHYYYKNGVNRYIYREAFKNLLSEKHINYTFKNDFARWEYYQNGKTRNLKEEIVEAIEEIHTNKFRQYVHFDKLVQYVKNVDEKKDGFLLSKILRNIKTCKNLQFMMDDNKKQ